MSNEKELMRLCGLMVDGTLEADDARRFAEMLDADADARALYRNVMDVHARLLLLYEEVPAFEASTDAPQSDETSSPWWQYAAAALILFTGLNVIQSAGNLTAALPFESAPLERGPETYLTQLNEALHIEQRNQP